MPSNISIPPPHSLSGFPICTHPSMNGLINSARVRLCASSSTSQDVLFFISWPYRFSDNIGMDVTAVLQQGGFCISPKAIRQPKYGTITSASYSNRLTGRSGRSILGPVYSGKSPRLLIAQNHQRLRLRRDPEALEKDDRCKHKYYFADQLWTLAARRRELIYCKAKSPTGTKSRDPITGSKTRAKRPRDRILD